MKLRVYEKSNTWFWVLVRLRVLFVLFDPKDNDCGTAFKPTAGKSYYADVRGPNGGALACGHCGQEQRSEWVAEPDFILVRPFVPLRALLCPFVPSGVREL